MKKILRDNWQYFYFLVLTIVIFAGFIFSSRMLFGSDTMEAGIFFRSFYADFVKTYHRIPMWNPYIFGGLPFVDAMHGDTFYPLAVLQFFLPITKALGYKLVITVFLAGVFTYLYLKKMGMTKWASVFGGTVYMLSGFLVSLVYAGQDGRMYVTSLLPLLLYTMEIGFQRKKLLGWWPFAVAFGLLVMANHPQFAYFAMWCVGAYFIVRMIFVLKEEKTGIKRWFPIPGFILGMMFGLCLSLVAIWPNQDYVRKYSPRAEGGRGYEYAASWSLHAEEAFSQIIPGFAGYSNLHQGEDTDLASEPTYWGKNYFKINTETAGFLAIILAVIGLFLYRDRFSWFFVGTGIFALLYALGSSGLIFRIIYYTVPFVSSFRAPSTIMFLFCFAATFLAARAIDQLEKNKKIPRATNIMKALLIGGGLYFLAAILVAGGGLGIMKIYTSIFYPKIEPGQLSMLETNLPNIAGGLFAGALFIFATALLIWGISKHKIPFKTGAILFFTLAIADGWILTDARFIKPVDPSPYFAKPPIVSILQKDPRPFRVFAMPQTLSNQNILAQFGIDEVAGYHGNQLRWYDNFIGGSGMNRLFTFNSKGQALGFSPNLPKILGLTNTEYFLWNQKYTPPGLQLAGTSPDGINIYQDTSQLGRVRIIHEFDVIPDPEQALSKLMDPSYDYTNRIIIDRAPQSQIMPAAAAGDTAVLLDSPADRIRVRATLSSPGFLALQDNWYPFWKAYEGNSELPIYRSDYTFMAIELPSGTHEIELRLENPKYILGKNIAIASWILLFAGLGAGAVIGRFRKAGQN